MNSEICPLNNDLISLNIILEEVEKFTKKCELNKKDALKIRLLAEELKGMLPTLVENFEGFFWLENEGNKFELHVEFDVNKMSLEVKDKLIALSTSGKNEAAKGVMGKIRSVAETMILSVLQTNTATYSPYSNLKYMDLGLMYIDPASVIENSYLYSWSLTNYKDNVFKQELKDEYDELEYSIVANIADDILVGIKGKFVEITIKKKL